MFQVAADSGGKVNGCRTGQRGMGAFIERGGHGASHIVFQHFVDVFYNAADKPTGVFLGFFGNLIFEHEKRGRHLQVGFEIVEQLRFEQKLFQSLALNRVVLHHRDGLAVEETAQISQPTGNMRRRRSPSRTALGNAFAFAAVDCRERLIHHHFLR